MIRRWLRSFRGEVHRRALLAQADARAELAGLERYGCGGTLAAAAVRLRLAYADGLAEVSR